MLIDQWVVKAPNGNSFSAGAGNPERCSMLELTDPLWEKRDDALRHCESASELAVAWNDEIATSLFWDSLCHQRTCYDATYAVAPHLLPLAEPVRHPGQTASSVLPNLTTCMTSALRGWSRSRTARPARSRV
jgi:hypothetical protein